MTCEGGEKPSAQTRSHPATLAQRPFRWAPKVFAQGGKVAELRLKATRLLQPEGRFAGRQVFAQGGEREV